MGGNEVKDNLAGGCALTRQARVQLGNSRREDGPTSFHVLAGMG
jgi:hypothetical protein